MTVTTNKPASSGAEVQPHSDLVTLTIDDIEVSVPKGTLIIRAAELIGIQVPRFCDHPLLDPVGACRQCLVEVPDAGNGRAMPKPQASCTTTVAPGMVVRTQLTSPVADKAQQGNMEMLLINHPLDCPVCDKGGECPLQNQSMSNGRGETRYEGVKRTFPKPVAISSQVLLDRERCVLCARCTRFSTQIAGDPFIEMLERGALQQVGIYEKAPFESYFSGNTVQICPVGALTGAAYRFRARPFDLVSSPSVCEHCASGCALRTDHRRGKVTRRLAGDDPQVNEEWNCDKGRWAFQYAGGQDRLTTPLVRDERGDLVPTSWPDALATAARGLAAARGRGVGVLAGGRLTLEDAYAYSKLARVALGTNDVDFRARPASEEEAGFLAAHVAGRGPAQGAVTYADLEGATSVLLVGLEPEEESPIVFLRLRKAVRTTGLAVWTVAPFASRGAQKLRAGLLVAVPGAEAALLDRLAGGDTAAAGTAPPDADATPAGQLDPGAKRTDAALPDAGATLASAARALAVPGAVVLVGERLAELPGALSAVERLVAATGARVAWVPRRAGERGALDAGLLPGLLPGGRTVADAPARVDVATAWGVPSLPTEPGRDGAAMLAAAATGRLGALVVGGVDPADLPDPAQALAALDTVPFVLSLELRASAVTARADVVLPVAPVVEKAGTFVDWEGRARPFEPVLRGSNALPDVRVLHLVAAELGIDLGLPDVASARAEIEELGPWAGVRPDATPVPAPAPLRPASGQAVLATWHLLLDNGRLQDGDPYLAGTARRPVVRLSAATAAALGASDGAHVTVTSGRGALTLPLEITAMADSVVWLPTNSGTTPLRECLAAGNGSLVSLSIPEGRVSLSNPEGRVSLSNPEGAA